MMVVRRKTWGREERERGGSGKREGRGEMHSHLSSNYTTTLITLGLELIAKVQRPASATCSFVIAAES